MSHHYAGHVPHRVRDSTLAYEPGTSREQAQKKFSYSNVLVPAALHSEETISVTAAASEQLNRQAFVKPDPGVQIIYLPVDKECQLKSTVGSNHVDFEGEIRMLAELDDEHIAAAFAAVDKKGQGFVLPSETRMVLREALHLSGYKGEPTVHQLKLLNGFLGGGWERRIPLEEYISTIRRIEDHMRRELHSLNPAVVKASVSSANWHRSRQEANKRSGILGYGGAGATLAAGPSSPASQRSGNNRDAENPVRPGLLQEEGSRDSFARSQATEADDGLGRSATRGGHRAAPSGFIPVGFLPHSSYQLDIGGAEDPGPVGRPAMDAEGTGIWQTTRDLSTGTSKICKHTPGYAGHIPKSPTGEQRRSGADTREVNKINLTENYHRRLPGFGGHIPDFTSGHPETIRKAQGPAAVSDYERANYAITQYWQAKKAAGIKR